MATPYALVVLDGFRAMMRVYPVQNPTDETTGAALVLYLAEHID